MPRPRTTGRKSADARQVLVRLSTMEYDVISRAANGLSLSAWMRAVVLGDHYEEGLRIGRSAAIAECARVARECAAGASLPTSIEIARAIATAIEALDRDPSPPKT